VPESRVQHCLVTPAGVGQGCRQQRQRQPVRCRSPWQPPGGHRCAAVGAVCPCRWRFLPGLKERQKSRKCSAGRQATAQARQGRQGKETHCPNFIRAGRFCLLSCSHPGLQDCAERTGTGAMARCLQSGFALNDFCAEWLSGFAPFAPFAPFPFGRNLERAAHPAVPANSAQDGCAPVHAVFRIRRHH
jgi:hypothetical protein